MAAERRYWDGVGDGLALPLPCPFLARGRRESGCTALVQLQLYFVMTDRGSSWCPTTIKRFVQSFDTGTAVVRVETDCGEGFLKALGNPAGPHALACELVGTQLAKWFKLSTFDYDIVSVTSDDEIPFYNGQRAAEGPAFISRFEAGLPWGGSKRELDKIINRAAFGRLVVFDTWTRNCDRYPADLGKRRPNRDNVYFSRKGGKAGKLVLKAIDHTHCFTCGRELSSRLSNIGTIEDPRLYGLFPEFQPLICKADVTQAVADLKLIRRTDVETMVAAVPAEWQVSSSARAAWVELICRRADFVARTVSDLIWPQGELDL